MDPVSPTHCPSTPSFRNPLQFLPMNSSPLADADSSPSTCSPSVAAQERRRSQYKALAPVTPVRPRQHARLVSGGSTVANFGSVERVPKASLRDKFKARCFERARRARDKALNRRRSSAMSEPSSDDFLMEEDESEDEEDIMQDELYRRIVESSNRQRRHAYRVSYADEVGSSFDPAIDEVDEWEQELNDGAAVASSSAPPIKPSASIGDIEEEFGDEDLDDAELEAYAEECARHAALEDFEDIPEEELFAWDEDLTLDAVSLSQSTVHASQDPKQHEILDADMDMS